MITVKLKHLAHCRSGDKGNTSNIAVIAYSPELFDPLKHQLTAEKFKDWYRGVVNGDVNRYIVEKISALNFVCESALGGGVSRSLCLDNYGKSLSSRILSYPIELDTYLIPSLINYPLQTK
jgi:hypothetical protein